MIYNSAFCFIDATTKAWKQRTTANSDILPFEEDTYQILMLESALVVQKELYGNNFGAQTDVSEIQNDLIQAYQMYRLNHTDESLEPEELSYILGDFMNGYTAESLNDDYGNNSGEQGSLPYNQTS